MIWHISVFFFSLTFSACVFFFHVSPRDCKSSFFPFCFLDLFQTQFSWKTNFNALYYVLPKRKVRKHRIIHCSIIRSVWYNRFVPSLMDAIILLLLAIVTFIAVVAVVIVIFSRAFIFLPHNDVLTEKFQTISNRNSICACFVDTQLNMPSFVYEHKKRWQ